MIHLPKIIGVCGRRRCGKDTIANYMCNKYGFVNKKIAHDLKHVVQFLFDFTDQQIESDEKDICDDHWNIPPRKALQFIGTDMMQYRLQEILPHIGRSFWIKSFIKKNLHNNNQPLVISDLRFPHEYEELKKYNIFVIRVDRPVLNIDIGVDEHLSEKEYTQIPADMTVTNDGTLEDLYKKIDNILIKFDQTKASQ